MTDRELLEMAAKAAGIEVDPANMDTPIVSLITTDGDWWNPLTDDGDALRLAAKLYLWEAIRLAHRLVGTTGCPDIYAATRRAIVRAAAEIGKAMA